MEGPRNGYVWKQKFLWKFYVQRAWAKALLWSQIMLNFLFLLLLFFFFTPGIPQKTRHSSKVAGKCQHRRLSSDWILICLTKWTVKMGFCRSGNIGRILVRRNLKKINQFFTWICTDTRLTELYIHKTGQISKDKAARTKLSFMSPSKFQIEP